MNLLLRKEKPKTEVSTETKEYDFIQLKSKRALVVDDNFINLKVAMGLLNKMEVFADVAHNGVEAIQALQEFDYDLVFMDCQMPEMDGYEATRQIRRQVSEC